MTKDTRRGGGGRSKANSNGAHVSATFILSSPCRLLSESLSRRCLKSHLYVPFYVSAVQHGLSESGAWQKRRGDCEERKLYFPLPPPIKLQRWPIQPTGTTQRPLPHSSSNEALAKVQ